MKNQNDKILGQKQDEEITNRILIVFSFSLLLLLAVMFISRYMNSFAYVKTLSFCTIASIVFAVVGVVFVTFALIMNSKKANVLWSKRFQIYGGMSFLVAAVLLFIRLYNFRAFGILYAALPIIAFLYMIFNVYQRDFFYQSIVIGFTAGTLYAFSRWLHYKPWKPVVHITYILAIALLIAAVAIVLILKKRKGILLNIKLLSHNANYSLMFLSLGIMLLSIIVVLAVGSGIAFWAMVGVLGYLFVLAVYYTIKLM